METVVIPISSAEPAFGEEPAVPLIQWPVLEGQIVLGEYEIHVGLRSDQSEASWLSIPVVVQ